MSANGGGKNKTCMDIETHHVTPFFIHFAIAAAETWRKISIYVCIPALIAASANAYNLYARHQAHLEHERHEGHEAVKYPYMRLRAKVCKTNIKTRMREDNTVCEDTHQCIFFHP